MTSAQYDLLDSYNANTLAPMAEAAGLAIKQGSKKLSKANLIALMEKEFFTEARIKASLAQLTPVERVILERLQHRQGKSSSAALKRELLRANLIKETPKPTKHTSPYYGYETETAYKGSPNHNTSIFEDILARLTYHGLVFSQFIEVNPGNSVNYKFDYSPSTHLFIPPFVLQFLPPPAPLKVQEASAPLATRVTTPDFLLRELYLYWDFVRRNPLPLLQTGLVGKRSLKQINGLLMKPDTTFESARQESEMPHLYQLRQMLQALGLIKTRNNTLEVPEKERLELPAFWQLSQSEMMKKCVEAQVSLPGTNYLAEDSANYSPQQTPARKLVVEQIKNQPVNTWLEADMVLEAVQNQNANFLFAYRTDAESSRYNSGYYGYGIYHYGDRRDLLQKLQKFEEKFVRGVIGSLLFDLGLVELGFRSEAAAATNEWFAFRITPLGAAAFGNPVSAPPTPTDQGRLVIQPNFQLLALGPVPLAVLAKIDLFAARQKADHGVVEYQLTRESVYAAQQAGFTVPEIITYLTQTTSQTLPQNVQRSLEEWAAHHDRIVFRRSALLLQAASPELLANLTAHKNVGQYLARPLTADIALVTGKKKPVIAALLTADLLPAVSAITPEAADKSVLIDAQGQIEAVHAVPGLHVSGRVSRLADEIEPRRWQITEKKIRQAGGSKRKVEAVVAELVRLNRGKLPENLVTQIKAWGGYYGAAAVETLTLIEFRDRETLDELLKHEGLRPHLQPFPTQDRALVVVSEASLNQVRQILIELGMSIDEQIRR